MPHGTTLLELLAVIAVLVILAGVALPAGIRLRDQALVTLHARELATAVTATREAARRAGARAELVAVASGYRLRVLHPQGIIPGWQRPGPARDAVSLAGPATPFVFDSRGFALGVANRTYVLTRGQARRQVVISRLGRLRILP